MRFVILVFVPVIFATCPPHYTNLYGDKCYRYHTELENFTSARIQCLSEGADLVSIHAQKENDRLVESAPLAGSYWLGLGCEPSSSTFYWTDELPFDYSNFASGAMFCNTSMGGLIGGDGRWIEEPALSNKHPFICASEKDNHCGSGFTYIEELSRCVRSVEFRSTWMDAERACSADGAHLISIHSEQENKFVRRLALSAGARDGVFVGALYDGRMANATWTDGTAFTYSNFDPGMPDVLFGSCAALLTASSRGEWISTPCESQADQLPYLCAKPSPCPVDSAFEVDGEIYSPNYPSSFTTGLSCDYRLAATPGDRLGIVFPEFALVEGDSIRLYSGIAEDQPFATITAASPLDHFLAPNDESVRMVYTSGRRRGLRRWRAEFLTIPHSTTTSTSTSTASTTTLA